MKQHPKTRAGYARHLEAIPRPLALRRSPETRRRHAGNVATQVVMHVAGVKAQRRPRLVGIAHGGETRAPRRAEELDSVGNRHRWLLAYIAGNSESKIGKRKDRAAHDRPHTVEVLRSHFELAHRMTRREVNHLAPTSLAGKPIAREDSSRDVPSGTSDAIFTLRSTKTAESPAFRADYTHPHAALTRTANQKHRMFAF